MAIPTETIERTEAPLRDKVYEGPDGGLRPAVRPAESPHQKRAAIHQVKTDLNSAYEQKPPSLKSKLEQIPRLEDFEAKHKRFEFGFKAEPQGLEKGEKALSIIPEVWKVQEKLDQIRDSQIGEASMLKLKLSLWMKYLAAFLVATDQQSEPQAAFWARFIGEFEKLGEKAKEFALSRQQGVLGDLAVKRAYLENGFEVWDSLVAEDALGIDFFIRTKPQPALGGMMLGQIEIHQVKSRGVDSAKQAARLAPFIVDRVPLGEGYSTDRPKKFNKDLQGWGKYFKVVGKVLPGVRHEIPFNEKTVRLDGSFVPSFSTYFKQRLIGRR